MKNKNTLSSIMLNTMNYRFPRIPAFKQLFIIKILLAALLFIQGYSLSFGQHNLEIKMSGIEGANAKITMIAYAKGREFSFGEDSLRKGIASLIIPDSIQKGMINLVFTGNLPIKEFQVIYTKENLKIMLDPSPGKTRFDISGTGETPLYYSVHLVMDSLAKRIMKFREIMAGLSNEVDFVKKTGLFLNKEKTALDSIYADLHKQYRQSLFIHFLDADRYRFPDTKLSTAQQRQDITDHYFDYFNPLDSLLLFSSVYNAKIEDYLEVAAGKVSSAKYEGLEKAVDVFMGKVAVSSTLSKTVLALMRTWLNKNSFDEVLEYMDVNYTAKQCGADNDIDLQDRLAAYKRLAVGNAAPEITWTGENNKVQKLSEVTENNTLVIFWATWCQHCQKLLPALNKYLSETTGIKVIAIGLDEDEQYWSKIIKYFPQWVQIRAPEKWKNTYCKQYGVTATPIVYLLDKDHKIMQKVKDLDELKEALGK